MGLSFGAALVIHPALGSGVRASSGETPSSFIAALFAGGSSVSIVGSGALEPHTETFRLFYFFTALAGTAVASLVLTYLVQIYTALLRRNTVALDIDTWSGQTGDAVELLTRLFPEGQTSAGYNVMVQWASAMTSVKETHHFYPVLGYFRFTDARYSMARTALVTLEAAALIRTALDAQQSGGYVVRPRWSSSKDRRVCCSTRWPAKAACLPTVSTGTRQRCDASAASPSR